MQLLSPKQLEFCQNATAKWNLAHGSVRSGKTVGTLFSFMHAVDRCPDSQLAMIGKSSTTIFQNAIRLLLERPALGIKDALSVFRPYCTWASSQRQLKYKDKTISTYGAKDEGAIGAIQGATFSLAYCDEITLYPTSIINMIDTRLSMPHSKGYASMNPDSPSHIVKSWIDKAIEGDPNYYALHFTLNDNPFVDEGYKERIRKSLTGLFYKRNYLGLWCQAEGAIFDFFERGVHSVKRPPRAAEYFIAGIDYGTVNNFACMLIGISTGRYTQSGVCRWVEAEYVWDSKKMERQKTNSEYARDVFNFLEPYGVKQVYVDPTAAAFKLELRRAGLHVVDADNDVQNGLSYMCSEMALGNLFVMDECSTMIREIESYVWDEKLALKGEDAPLKKNDHCIDAVRYAIYTHKVANFDVESYYKKQEEYMRQKFHPKGFGFR